MRSFRTLVSGLAVIALVVALGCGPTRTGPKGGASSAKGSGDGHDHGSGPHGGAIADWGGGKYHIEFTVDHDKQEATVYILGSDAKSAAPVKAKDGQLAGNIKGVQNKDVFQIVLKADPQKGEPEGKSSRYVAKHEKIGTVQEFEGTISGEADGTPYTGDFKEEPAKK